MLTQQATPRQKIAMFRSLFRGRTDVFPVRWENRSSGKSGYAPSCANEWVRSVCDKPRIKCGDCRNQAFIAVSDLVIEQHLRGDIVAGVYPLSPGNTCYFVAVDFDGKGWAEDSGMFVHACAAHQVPRSVRALTIGSRRPCMDLFLRGYIGFACAPTRHRIDVSRYGTPPRNRL